MESWFNLVINSDRYRGGGPEAVVFALLLSFIIGQLVGWVYQKTHRGMSYSQSFTASLVVMPVLVSLMMMLMSGNLSIAFGLLAVFAVVRFRNVLKDTRDTIFILWSIIEGMAVGTGQVSSGIIGAVGVAVILFYLSWTQYGARKSYDTIINLLCSIGDDKIEKAPAELVESVLARHCLRMQLASAQETPTAQINLSYRLTLRDPARRLELESDLRDMKRIDRVSVFSHDDESEI